MMRQFFALALCGTVLVGCNTPPADDVVAPTKKAQTGEKEPARSTQTVPKITNPNRINQLADLESSTLKVNGKTVQIWLMDNDSKRQEGMMFLVDKDVPNDRGMLFLFSSVQPAEEHGFWMKNCPLGLDIVYVDKNKKVVNVGDGLPFNETPVKADGPYQYVLELKHGQSKPFGIKKGSQLEFSDSLKSKD